ncbi:unnamed protein product [Discosporangium mesarthrocarpum]
MSTTSEAFVAPNLVGWRIRVVSPVMQASGNGGSPSYAERLQQAKATKLNVGAAGGSSTPPPQLSTAEPLSVEPVRTPHNVGGQHAEPAFSEEIQEDLRTAITLLTARMQREVPMSRSEYERFEAAISRIVEDAVPQDAIESSSTTTPIGANGIRAAAVAAYGQKTSIDLEGGEPSTPPQVTSTTDDFESEGPKWDGKGYGLPSGTVNTYTIDGMGTMNPEEYQEALRQRVSKRAQESRKRGMYGNIAAKDYLSFLNRRPKFGDKNVEEQEKKSLDEKFDKY